MHTLKHRERSLHRAYREMAADERLEAEAAEWVEEMMCDIEAETELQRSEIARTPINPQKTQK